MTITASHIVQTAIFKRFETRSTLAKHLHSSTREATLPHISFDGITSRQLENAENIETHEFGFSVWDETQATDRAATLANQLCRLFEAPLTLTGYHVFDTKHDQTQAKHDTQSQLWRVKLAFTLTTQKS